MDQDLDIIATRPGVRQPRVGIVGRVVGTLVVTEPAKNSKVCCKSGGTAEQGPAAACLSLGSTSLLHISLEPSVVGCGQELAINNRDGPVEAVAGVGCYHLNATFRVAATQGKGVFYRQYAVADFDPAPQLDSFWADALKPFRAVPRRDFGFKVIVRVVEDAGPEAVAPK
jgi:hypothetical protein